LSLSHLKRGKDKDGIAIILCEQNLENKYKGLVQGKTILESSLHTNLSEHLNSEIGIGTITNVTAAKEWLRGSFLFQRIRKNPKHYELYKPDSQTWEDRVEELIIRSVAKLRETQLIEAGDNDAENEELVSTEYGDIMSKVGNRKFCPFRSFNPAHQPTALHPAVNCMYALLSYMNFVYIRSSR
jgi:ATP-dependent DNA helicase HFM1/MER3